MTENILTNTGLIIGGVIGGGLALYGIFWLARFIYHAVKAGLSHGE